MKNFGRWVNNLSTGGKIGLSIASLFVLGSVASAFGPHDNTISSSPVVTKPAPIQSPVQKTETKTVSETQAVPYETTQVNDSTMSQESSATRTEGQEGVRTLTYKVTYVDGRETNRELVSNEITTQPVSKVVAVGTKVKISCPSGTYTNSAGNQVCSPYESSTAPSGATAQCQDGTYSFSQSRRGTCSHHGGVARWL